MPSKKKKKKKDKNRDIDIIQKVQDSVQTELERLKNSTLALGQNPGDAQPVVKDNVSGKKKKKMKKDKSEKKLKPEVSVTVNEGTGEDGGSKSEEFKPYDYSNAAEKLKEGGFEGYNLITLTYEPPRGKTNNVVSEQVRHKPACSVTEKS